MNNLLGIMQGRLSKPLSERVQEFPKTTWRDEFALAKAAGISWIEWIDDWGVEKENPIFSEQGRIELRSLSKEYGIRVGSICADYFMECPLIGEAGEIQSNALEHLRVLLEAAGAMQCRHIVLPFVDASSLIHVKAQNALPEVMERILPDAVKARVELHLETDLHASLIASLLRKVNRSFVKANFDIGNSASLGFKANEEIRILAEWIGSVHVKDRMLGGGTVRLGEGDADFDTCFQVLKEINYEGPYILQVAREEGLSEVDLAKRNKEFVMNGYGFTLTR